MKITLRLWGVVLFLTLASCNQDNRREDKSGTAPTEQKTPVKLIEYLIGEWEMASTPGQSDQQDNPGERIRFTTDARYIVFDGTTPVDSGSYRMNEQLTNIYLESDLEGNPREYDLELQERQMTLTPMDESPGQEALHYAYRRIGPAYVAPGKEDMSEGRDEQN